MTELARPSASHLVIIPSYNTGPALFSTVEAALEEWQPVYVVIDGSDDGTQKEIMAVAKNMPYLRVITLQENQGKGAAIIAGMREAHKAGFDYVLAMDADGQHPADRIRDFMALSIRNRDAMILGTPDFGEDAPWCRRQGRRVGNWWTSLETLWGGVHDSLFGFRVYPISPALRVLESISSGRRYDFDTQLAVRLFWLGIRPVNISVPVRYPSKAQGGISHFHYLRDNLLLIKTHIVLVIGAMFRFHKLLKLRARK